jgi:hypothetical protein
MHKCLSIPAILALWVIVHLDWHLARSHHHRLSMEWHQHWIVGIVAFFFLVLFCAWKWPKPFVRVALFNSAIGLFLGHIVEAWIESQLNHEAIGAVLTPERWHAFFQFSLAGIAGLLLGMFFVFGKRRLKPAMSY